MVYRTTYFAGRKVLAVVVHAREGGSDAREKSNGDSTGGSVGRGVDVCERGVGILNRLDIPGDSPSPATVGAVDAGD